MLDALASGKDLADETIVWTKRQTAGRGQMGNGWEAEPDKNISFSMLLKPEFLHPREQFVISQITALSVRQAIAEMLNTSVSIKWPNDIYVGDEKIAGILIENRLQGSVMSHCVLGIGINVNQERWIGNAPNPTSLKLIAGRDFSPEFVLDRVTQIISGLYHSLMSFPDLTTEQIRKRFMIHLYRNEGLHPYVDAQSGETFEAQIVMIDESGHLYLQTQNGSERVYSFKEVKFVLPCGVTKE